jgi:hypothetical protein
VKHCRTPLHNGCPKHHGHKGDPGVTPGTCGAGGEMVQVILVRVRDRNSPSLCTLLFLGGWLPILDIPIFHVIPGSIWFSIKVLYFLFVYIWVRAAFP